MNDADTRDVRTSYPVLWSWWEGRIVDLIDDLARGLDGEQSGDATISEAVTLLGSRLLVELERLYEASDTELMHLSAWAEEHLEDLWKVLGRCAGERPLRVERRRGRRAADQAVFEGWLRGVGDREVPFAEARPGPSSPPPALPAITPVAGAPPPLTVAALVGHHIATPAQPLPAGDAPIVWIVAQNGTFKRGCSPDLELVIQADSIPSRVPGLAALLPSVRWSVLPPRPLGDLLGHLLDDARRAVSDDVIARPVEKQYFIVWRSNTARLIAPTAQQGTVSRLRYEMPQGEPVLCDIHSHHEMQAYFSGTDDRDDLGLSVSVVIGRIYSRPELLCRLNVYGHRQVVPASMVFGHLGPFHDAYEREEVRACSLW